MLKEWVHKPGDTYIVTGVKTNGQRFRLEFNNPHHANSINLYRGSMWCVRDGRRKLFKRVYN